MSGMPNEAIRQQLELIYLSREIARQNHDIEVLRLADAILIMERAMVYAEINSTTVRSSVDSRKPRDIEDRQSYLQPNVMSGGKGSDDDNGDMTNNIEDWFNQVVTTPGSGSITRRSLITEYANHYHVSAISPHLDRHQFEVRAIRRFADEILHTRFLLDYAFQMDFDPLPRPKWVQDLYADIN